MIKQSNPGALLPFYSTTASVKEHTRHITNHGEGWKILASNRRLIPFILWESAAPKTVSAFQVINIETGKIYSLSTGLITRQKRADNSKTWYFFTDAGIGTTLPCGLYVIRLELTSVGYMSDVVEVINATGPEYTRLDDAGCAAGVLTLAATDAVVGSVVNLRTEYRETDATAWIDLPSSAGPPWEYEIDMTAITLNAGENVVIRRTILTDAGNTLQTLFALSWDSGDPCGTYQFVFVEDSSTYANRELWALDLSDSLTWEDKVYKAGFFERAYLRAFFDIPEVEREIETLISNTGALIASTASTREFMVMDFKAVPDQFIYPLSALGDYSTLYLRNIVRETEIALPPAEVTMTFEPDNGKYYSRGRLRWRNNRHFESACVEGETTETP